MARPSTFSFSIENGDPVALATAFRDIVAALAPLSNDEARDLLRELAKMYEAEHLTVQLLDALSGIVKNHDSHNQVDESWWQAGRDAIANAEGGRGG